MKTSVVVCAYNEELNISTCLNSLLTQTLTPSEIIVIIHNCADKTLEIVKQYKQVKPVILNGPMGQVYARIKGFEIVTGDVVVNIDGDSWADKDWLKNLVEPFKDQSISAVGGYVAMNGSVLERLGSWDYFFFNRYYKSWYRFYFWGANFACRKRSYIKVGGLKPLISLENKLNLFYWAEDLYLSLQLEKVGKVVFAPKAKVYSKLPHMTLGDRNKRYKHQESDRVKIFKYFGI